MTPTEAARIAAQEQEWRGLLLEWQEMLEKVKPEIDRLTARAEAAERKAAAAHALALELEEAVRWIAQTVHQAHHQEDGASEECPKNTCGFARTVLKRLAPAPGLLAERRAEFTEQLHRAETHPDEPTVHALWNGIAECGLSIMAAGEWPRGHRWVRRGEPGVNCGVCLAVQAKVTKENP